MKVFLFSLILLIIVAALFFMVSSRETIAPIAYLYLPLNDETYPPNFNFQVMDVNTGGIIAERATEVADCPYGISDDGQWLRYGVGIHVEAVHHRLNLLTMEDEVVDQSNPSELQYPENARPYAAGDSVVYVVSDIEAKLFTIYWPDGQSKSFEFAGRVGIIEFSNDARFMLYATFNEAASEAELYILDTNNGELQLLEDAQVAGQGTWHPVTNQLLYHIEIREGNAIDRQVVIYDPITRERQNLYRYSYYLNDVHLDYYWSEDAQNLLIEVKTFYDASHLIYILNLPNYESIHIASFTDDIDYGSGVIGWTSPTEFTYIVTDVQGYSPYEGNSDIFLYNVETQSSSNLTNTPDIVEFKQCFWG